MPDRRPLLPDLLPAAELLAKGVRHVLCYVTEALGEKRKAFQEYEVGDFADALADAEAERDVLEPPVAFVELGGFDAKLCGCGEMVTTATYSQVSAACSAADDPAGSVLAEAPNTATSLPGHPTRSVSRQRLPTTGSATPAAT